MGFFRWGRGTPCAPPDAHEQAHDAAGRGEGLDGYWWDDNGRARIAHEIPPTREGSRKAAIVLAAGYLSGGGDAKQDRKAAEMFAREARVPLKEIEAEARRKGYVR